MKWSVVHKAGELAHPKAKCTRVFASSTRTCVYGNVVIAKACRVVLTGEDLRTESVLAGLIAAFTSTV